jgi:hypothetical protein
MLLAGSNWRIVRETCRFGSEPRRISSRKAFFGERQP